MHCGFREKNVYSGMITILQFPRRFPKKVVYYLEPGFMTCTMVF